MKNILLVSGVAVIFLVIWSIYLVSDSRENRDHSGVVIVPQAPRSAAFPVDRASSGTSSIEEENNASEVGDKTLAEKFEIEPRNSVWATSTEKNIRRSLSNTTDIQSVEVFCKTSVCKITGEFHSLESSQIDKVLKEIRLAANFKEPSNSSSHVTDNTIYKIVQTNPPTVRFSNFSKW